VYWAALSHSKEVLEVLCSLAQSGSCNIDVSIPDHSNSTPLDVAVASQQWDMVKLLLQSGGLKVRSICNVLLLMRLQMID
jgi:ankyrin repeat protein